MCSFTGDAANVSTSTDYGQRCRKCQTVESYVGTFQREREFANMLLPSNTGIIHEEMRVGNGLGRDAEGV